MQDSSDLIMNSAKALISVDESKGIGPRFILLISVLAIFFAFLFVQKGHSARDILAYLTFVFIVVYSVRRA